MGRQFDPADYGSEYIDECKRQIERYRSKLRVLDYRIADLQQQAAEADDELARWEANLEQEYNEIREEEGL